MSNNIKPGDRVKGINGESVLVGTVSRHDPDHHRPFTKVNVDNDHYNFSGGGRTLHHANWTIEKLLPAEPPVGSVIRLESSQEWVHNSGLWVRTDVGMYPWKWINTTEATLVSGSDWKHLNEAGTVTVEVTA